jgi:hypothetical protein
MIDQMQIESMEYFKYLVRFIIIDARCTHESKSRISKAKQHLPRRKIIGLKFKKETS